MAGVGVGLEYIFSHYPQCLQVTSGGSDEHLRDAIAHFGGVFCPVIGIIQCNVSRVGHIEITGTLVRLNTHIGRTLHVILTAKRVDTCSCSSYISCHHGDV